MSDEEEERRRRNVIRIAAESSVLTADQRVFLREVEAEIGAGITPNPIVRWQVRRLVGRVATGP